MVQEIVLVGDNIHNDILYVNVEQHTVISNAFVVFVSDTMDLFVFVLYFRMSKIIICGRQCLLPIDIYVCTWWMSPIQFSIMMDSSKYQYNPFKFNYEKFADTKEETRSRK